MVKLFTTYSRPLVEYALVVLSQVEVSLRIQLERQCRLTRRLFDFYAVHVYD